MRFSRIYSIMVEGTEAGERGFFITFQVLAKSAEEAINLLTSSNEMKNIADSKIEEVDEKGISIKRLFASNPEILHQTGRAYY